MKIIGRFVKIFWGHLYDLFRYLSYSAWSSKYKEQVERDYFLVKVYHTLEKSLSYKDRKIGSGWSNVKLLLDELVKKDRVESLHEKIAISVLRKFFDAEGPQSDSDNAQLHAEFFEYVEETNSSNLLTSEQGGACSISKHDFIQLKNKDINNFIKTRHSIREYTDEQVSNDVIHKVIELAMSAPSVCNRQEWKIYSITGPSVQKALSFQDGNRGFGHKVKNLFIVTIDLKAFVSFKERYQCWIDGGILSMAILNALHSQDLVACCLNWSQSPVQDLKLRRALNIDNSHQVIMMISFGYPLDNIKYCSSERVDMCDILRHIK